jgi:hypothetical protein
MVDRLIISKYGITMSESEWTNVLDTYTLDEIQVIWFDLFDLTARKYFRPYLQDRVSGRKYGRQGRLK